MQKVRYILAPSICLPIIDGPATELELIRSCESPGAFKQRTSVTLKVLVNNIDQKRLVLNSCGMEWNDSYATGALRIDFTVVINAIEKEDGSGKSFNFSGQLKLKNGKVIPFSAHYLTAKAARPRTGSIVIPLT